MGATGEDDWRRGIFRSVRHHSQLFSGILDATMTRGTGWHFSNVGSLLERADKTSRILDVKYFTLLPNVSDINTPIDDLLWSAMLRSVSGFEMFRKRHRVITIHRVVEFLILERNFPRAILYCIERACSSLEQIDGPMPNDQNPAILRIRELIALMKNVTAKMIIDGGMHEFIDSFQGKLNKIGALIRETYFDAKAFEHSPVLVQTQSQS
ncbi:MAG: alpha-E domain-containing protein [Pirellulaceae bacterium]|nr:alpha-E domain-containing protein [Pirellulaceae bacterium]